MKQLFITTLFVLTVLLTFGQNQSLTVYISDGPRGIIFGDAEPGKYRATFEVQGLKSENDVLNFINKSNAVDGVFSTTMRSSNDVKIPCLIVFSREVDGDFLKSYLKTMNITKVVLNEKEYATENLEQLIKDRNNNWSQEE